MSDTNSTSRAINIVFIENEEHTEESCTDVGSGICRERWSLGDPA